MSPIAPEGGSCPCFPRSKRQVPKTGGLVLVFALLTLVFSGCIGGPKEPIPGTRMEESRQLEVYIRLMGEVPGNLTGVEFMFHEIVFYQKDGQDWSFGGPEKNLSLDFQRPGAGPATTILLPPGVYTDVWSRLSSAVVHGQDGGAQQAVALETRCHVQLALDLRPPVDAPRLTLFLWLQDALVQQDGTWHVQPAFSGSFADHGQQEAAGSNGESRLAAPNCVSTQ